MTFENIYCATHTRAALTHRHTHTVHTHVCSSHVWPTQGIAQPPDKHAAHPSHTTTTTTMPEPELGCNPFPPLPAPLYNVCVCLPCVCVCVWVFIWYVVNPTGHIPHRRKGWAATATRAYPAPEQRQTHSHTHELRLECVCVRVWRPCTVISLYIIYHFAKRLHTSGTPQPPLPPPSIHTLGKLSPCLRSSLFLSIVSALPTPSAAA